MPHAGDFQPRHAPLPITHTAQERDGLSLNVPGNGAGHEAHGKSKDGQQDDVPWETASGSLAADKGQVGSQEDSIGYVVDSHISPHKLANWLHKGEDSDDGHCDEQLDRDDAVNLSNEGVSDFPVIPFSTSEAVTHCSLLDIIAWAVVHGHRVDGGHRLWVATRVTKARLWVGRVGRVPARQDRRLPVAPMRRRVEGVAVLIGRGGAGVGHGHSKAEGRPQLLGPG